MIVDRRLLKVLFPTVLIWLSLAGLSWSAFTWVLDLPKLQYLANNGKPHYAHVTAKNVSNRQLIEYEYVVGHQSYKGTGRALNGNLHYDDIKIGDRFFIFYDAENPNISAAGYPDLDVVTNKNFRMVATLVIPIMPTVFVGLLVWGSGQRAEI